MEASQCTAKVKSIGMTMNYVDAMSAFGCAFYSLRSSVFDSCSRASCPWEDQNRNATVRACVLSEVEIL